MHVGDLLREARARAGFSQRLLAKAAGTSQPAVAAWESGRVSPTVQTLDRLLAACGLQARVALEQLLAEVDARVDALLAADPELDSSLTSDLSQLCGSLRAAGVTWAVDGGCALRLHGLGATVNVPEVVFRFDDNGRAWLSRNGVRGFTARGPLQQSWFALDLAGAAEALQSETFGLMLGRLRLRPVDALPPTVDLAVGWSDEAVPVLTVDAVEQGNPQHAEVLSRLRQRRSLTS
jgi:transcriptional regulator with XRE-family HTH domain